MNVNTNGSEQVSKRPKLHYLDGLRGFSALMIAMFHAILFTGHTGVNPNKLPIYLKPLLAILYNGHYAVPVFIVLSGYSLTIPVALSENKELNGGFLSYIKRRARRILPPYYFALFFFLILIYCVPVLHTIHKTAWDSKIPVTFASIITHLLLIHNLKGAWIVKIDGPLWSVATEWQIYFLFPILIYIWKKANLPVCVVGTIILGIVAAPVFPPAFNMNSWFLGLFALGMLGANISFSKEQRWSDFVNVNNHKVIFYISSIVLIAVLAGLNIAGINNASIIDTVIGIFVCLLLVYFTFIENNSLKKPLFLKLLNSRFFMALGVFSYSIYLIHSPFLGLINLLTLDLPITTPLRWILMELVAVPISILIAYVFYLLAEKRFQTKAKTA